MWRVEACPNLEPACEQMSLVEGDPMNPSSQPLFTPLIGGGENTRALLTRPWTRLMLQLGLMARRLRAWEAACQGTALPPELDPEAPAFIYVGDIDPRPLQGFRLKTPAGVRRYPRQTYFSLTGGEEMTNGHSEAILPHEYAHVITDWLAGEDVLRPRSTKMHLTTGITDFHTAFIEGWAEHFEALLGDTAGIAWLTRLRDDAEADQTYPWVCTNETRLRMMGVKNNCFVRATIEMGTVPGNEADLYELYRLQQTSTLFTDELKTAQQMMSCEGVIATLFYQLARMEQFGVYCGPDFYQAFFGRPVPDPSAVIPEAFNGYVKSLYAIRRALNTPLPEAKPPVVAVFESYARSFPGEARDVFRVFVETTHGATMVPGALEVAGRMHHAGQIGDVARLKDALRDHRALIEQAIEQALSTGELAPLLARPVWMAGNRLKLAPALWVEEQVLPYRFDLNCATPLDLCTIDGVSGTTAQAICEELRERGPVRGVEELAARVCLDDGERDALIGALEK